jgi:curved DNA-binding protein CbpA
MAKTYYDVLGVDADADQEAIRDAYREKVKEYHPDVSDHPDAEERFKRVKRAEIVLADPEEREVYDRLGHEAYVDGDDPEPNRPSEDEVRWAAAQAAQGNHDHGGRSAGWRARERRARRSNRAEWFWDDEASSSVRGDGAPGSDDPFSDATATPGARSGSKGPAGGSSGTAGGSTAAAGGSTGASGGSSGAAGGSSGTAGGSTAAAGDPTGAAGGSSGPTAAEHVAGRTATDGWGGSDPQSSGHAVHQWTPAERSVGIPTPNWTQDDVVLLVSSLALYPILLFLTVTPTFPSVARAALGLCTIALIAFLLPRPAFGLPVFGTWSLLGPAALLVFDVPAFSAVALVVLAGVWLPLGYSVAVAMVLR